MKSARCLCRLRSSVLIIYLSCKVNRGEVAVVQAVIESCTYRFILKYRLGHLRFNLEGESSAFVAW